MSFCFLPGCGKGGGGEEAGGKTEHNEAAIEEVQYTEMGAKIAGAVLGSLKSELTLAMGTGGALQAIETCRAAAIPLTLAVADSAEIEVDIKRTSLRYRNPENAPDEHEREALAFFEARAAENLNLPSHYFQTVQRNGRTYYRYYKPLKVSGMCLACHGPADRISDEVAAVLKEYYPDDRATGYRSGDFRGVVRVEMVREG